jgi:protein-L-isoaspartate(D-aspartate) O-methyltransferase
MERDRLLALLEPEIRDARVLAAIAAVDRAAFVPPERRGEAWENRPLPIGSGQTISQPLVVAHMLELLDVHPGDRVLDVGTGSGWHAALLAELGGEVWTIERHAGLAERAAATLEAAGHGAVHVVTGDGARGLSEHAPYDAINVAAAAGAGVPEALENQLAPGGRLVVPVEIGGDQVLTLVRDGTTTLAGPVRFVPLVEGRAGRA